MPLHPEARAVLAGLEALGDPPMESSTPAAVRAVRASRIQPPTIALAEVRDVDADGIATRLYRPSTDVPLGLFLYFHGGGWVLGSIETHDHVARALAAESGCAVLSVDYRLAPEHPFPAGLDDAFAVSAWIHENAPSLGCDPERLAIGGDSAGANLAAVVTQSARFPFRFQLLVYPATDARGGTTSYERARRGIRAHERRHALVPRALPLGRGGHAERPAGLASARRRLRHSRHRLEHSSSPPSSIRCATRVRHTPTGSARWASRRRRPGTTG